MRKALLLGLVVLLSVTVAQSPRVAHLGLLGIIGLTGFAAWNLLCSIFFASAVGRSQDRLRLLPWRCALMGWLLVCLESWFLLSFAQPWLVLPVAVLNLLCLSTTLPAVARIAGERLGVRGVWAAAAGSLPLGLTLACPILGWLCWVQLLVAALGAAFLPRRWSPA